MTLQDYITDIQRLLHDSTFKFWSQQELTDYVNKARRKVAAETGCTRQLVPGVTMTTGVASYDFLSILTNRRITAILDIYWFFGATTRYPLRYFAYSEFSRQGSVMYSYQGVPIIWSQLGNAAFISPVPAQDYTADFDVAVEPLDLAALTDIDLEVYAPFSECVKFYACYLAKLKDQRRQQAEEFMADYYRERSSVISSGMIRRLVGS